MTHDNITTILAIESSCDETACAIVQKIGDEIVVLAETTATSLNKHIETRGIVPEVAAREQLKCILPVIQTTLQSFNASMLQSNKAISKQDSKVTSQPIEGTQDKHRHSVTTFFRDNTTTRQHNNLRSIDAIAVTNQPGLIGSLLVGVETARTLAYIFDLPLIPVDHVNAHPYGNFVGQQVDKSAGSQVQPLQPDNISHDNPPPSMIHHPSSPLFPALSWVISGGHTNLYLMQSHQAIQLLGTTVDDSAGECFDKCARVLGFPYPGGPEIEKLAGKFVKDPPSLLASEGQGTIVTNSKSQKTNNKQISNSKFQIRNENQQNIEILSLGFQPGSRMTSHEQLVTNHELQPHDNILRLPRPMIHSKNFNTSFSGLKTAFLRAFESEKFTSEQLAYELQEAICDVIVAKTKLAITEYPQVRSILLSGGVAANSRLRERLNSEELKNRGSQELTLFSPPLKYCTDNAVMIGAYALFHLDEQTSWQSINVTPNK